MDGSGKIRRELRHPDDVFDPKSLETLKYAPVTIEHPPEMINPENVDQYRVGHTTERVEIQQDKVDTDLIVESKEGIDAIEKDGIRELSSGYAADIIEEEGDFNGAPYDYRQVNIRYNHLAMVRRGRAGPEIRMRLDSADAVMQNEGISVPMESEFSQEPSTNDSEQRPGSENAIGEPEVKQLVISGREVELPSDVADTVQDYIDRFDEMRAKLAQLEDEMKASRKDADINQPGISPQVKVEQQGPDGRAASGKVAAKTGTITGPVGPEAQLPKNDKDEEEEKKDVEGAEEQGGVKKRGKADKEEEKDDDDDDDKKDDDYAAGAGTGAGGAAAGPVERMKQDIEAIRDAYKGDADLEKKLDALEGKMDAFASEGFGKNEKKGDRKDSASNSQGAVRARVKLERNAEKMVPYEVAQKFDSMSDNEIRAAVIKHHNPRADLEGKSHVYIQARFDSMCESIEETDTSEYRKEMGRRMLGIDGEDRMDGSEEVDPNAARLRMIKAGREEFKSNLSATKK